MYKQEGYRDKVAAVLEDQEHFAVLRRESGPSREWNWIAYRPRTMKVLDWGDQRLPGIDGDLPRWAQWASLRHRASGQDFTFINTHLVPPERSPASHEAQVEAVQAMIEESEDPVIVAGSFNENYRKDDERTNKQWAVEKFSEVGAISNWEQLDLTEIGTHGFPLHDYVFLAAEKQVARIVDHKVYRGFLSDHRMLQAKIRVRRVDTGA